MPQNARVSGSNRPPGRTGPCPSAAPQLCRQRWVEGGRAWPGPRGQRWGSSLHGPSDEMLGQVRGQALDRNGGLRSGEPEGCPALLGPSPRCLRRAGRLGAIPVPASGLHSRHAALGSAPGSPWSPGWPLSLRCVCGAQDISPIAEIRACAVSHAYERLRPAWDLKSEGALTTGVSPFCLPHAPLGPHRARRALRSQPGSPRFGPWTSSLSSCKAPSCPLVLDLS